MAASSSGRWWVIIASLVLGSLLGVYLQRFALTEPYFRDILSAGFNVSEVNLAFADFGFRFFLRCNLGTLVGGVFGLWAARWS
ncbi:hypothetical protein [Aminivibrio sp.]|jgi:hypothetical protein|uniref:hypothetical protein n=1 Tax=Aminivibrio sp. TaxID=1872489 RepID=UPI001A420A0C|nr:hypothetical protein [Aminivibrio sp.]MBL3540175.1 hypothetical protein [Aminivibrio sp.]MDK2959403.1 hypothetical protein [Synergistaceae bacterium]